MRSLARRGARVARPGGLAVCVAQCVSSMKSGELFISPQCVLNKYSFSV